MTSHATIARDEAVASEALELDLTGRMISRGTNGAVSGVGVLSVHHQEEARRATRTVVNGAPGFDIVGEAASAEEALELAVALRPNLALVGVDLPGIDGFETCRRLLDALPATTVVLLFPSGEPPQDKVAGSQAAAAVHDRALTPASLRALWDGR
jgi:CheY-like chemotaxis protein